jgi:hypothetical protein
MKKLAVILGLVLLFAVGATAQDKMVSYGFKAGADIANFTGDIEGNATKVGFIGGGFVEYTAAPQIGIQMEILYAMKGTKEDGGDGKLKFNYLEIPVLFKYMVQTQGSVTPFFFAGPQVGFLLSAKADPGGEDIKDGFESVDFGLAFGAGVNVQMQGFVLMLDGRYSLGLTNILKDVPADYSWKTSNIAFTAGVGFK